MDKNAQVFYEEAVELLANLEGNLLDLEKRPDSQDLINQIFRALHTLKGSGAMFGFNDLAAFVHNIENAFDKIRQGRVTLTPGLINLTLEARDMMKLLLEQEVRISDENAEKISDMTQAFAVMIPIETEDKKSSTDMPPVAIAQNLSDNNPDQPALNTFSIMFAPNHDFFASGNNPLIVIEELATLGEISITPDVSAVPDLNHINPESCYLAWEIILTTNVDINAVKDVFLFVDDICELKIEKGIVSFRNQPAEEKADLPTLAETAGSEKNTEQSLPYKADSAEPLPIETAPEKETGDTVVEQPEKPGSDRQITRSEHFSPVSGVKVDQAKLDHLIGLLGELVTIQARLGQTADNRGDAELITLSQELEALTGELRDSALKLSMLPISSIFSRLEKQVSLAIKNNQRQVGISFRGGETELDKTVMGKLFEPLSRIICFCVEHNIESEPVRANAEKPASGKIEFAAWHSSGNVCISIEDDGRQMQIESAEKNLSAARKLVEELRGTLDIRSTAGRGNIFSIRMPLNLAIIEGLMVKIEESLFVFPLALVEECIELTKADQNRNFNKNVVMLRGQIIPYIKLRDTFRMPGKAPDIQQIVIANVNHHRIGFTVDQVVGEYQTVIKSWGRFCNDTPGITGATILGDGTVALIADLAQLINEEKNTIESILEGSN